MSDFEIIHPYQKPYQNVSDLSGMLSNPFANLQVATGAAEMQAEIEKLKEQIKQMTKKK